MTTRREFLRSAAIVAACTALPLEASLASPVESDSDRLERLIKAGPVRGQLFVIDRPLPEEDYELEDVVLVANAGYRSRNDYLVDLTSADARRILRGIVFDNGDGMIAIGGSLSRRIGADLASGYPFADAYWRKREAEYRAAANTFIMPPDKWYGERGIYHKAIPIGSVNRERVFGNVL